MTGYGRKGRPRKSQALPTRGAIRRPEVAARVTGRVTLAVLYARAVAIREDQATGDLVADRDPRVCGVVPGDGWDEERDQPFVAMYFDHRSEPVSPAEIAANLDKYVATKQAALEQAQDRPPRPFIQRGRGPVVENLGSPSGAVIVAYLWRFYGERQGREPSPQRFGVWERPSGRLRDEIESIVGPERLALADEVYDELRPRRDPIA